MLWEGYWWATLHEDATKFVNECSICRAIWFMNNVTLFKPSKKPKWATNIVKYLQDLEWAKSIPRH